MADVYDVASHDEHTITLKQVGLHLGPGKVVIQRSQITSVEQKLGRITVTTAGGRYKVNMGIRRAQKALVAAAFGL